MPQVIWQQAVTPLLVADDLLVELSGNDRQFVDENVAATVCKNG